MAKNKCTIYGYLYGAICADLGIWDRIAGAEIFAVASSEKQPTIDSLARARRGESKLTVRDIDAKQAEQMAAKAIMRAKTDSDGAFCFTNSDYRGGLLDLYVCINRIPAPSLDDGSVALEEPSCLFVGTVQPFKFGDVWYLVIVIPSHVWCRIRRKADLWVIVGKVTPCDDSTVPLGGLSVTAKDVDIIQHDVLGTATTNASGVFRIDYPGAKFRLGTWINVELIGGPDVFFEIRDADANVLLDEPPSRGRQSDRSDRGPCFCVRLCVDVKVPSGTPIPAVWTKVGTAFTIPDAGGLNDFDADGYAGSLKYALHGTVRLLGSAPRATTAGNPVEYRYLISDSTTPNGSAPPAGTSFTRIVGVGADAVDFANTLVGQMVRTSPYKVVDVYAYLEDLDGEGWLDVNTSITRTFVAHPTLTPADIPDFDWVDLDALMALNTAALTTESNVPAGAGNPGDPVPASDRIAIEKKAIRFEIREVVDKPGGIFNLLPGSGTTLNSIVLNNNVAYMKVAMTEHLSSTACTPLSGTPHVAFTAYHPHLADVNVNVRSNDGTYNHNLNDAASKPPTSDSAIPLSGNVDSPGVNHLHDPAVALPTAGLKKCTYIVTLRVLRRLHNGGSPVDANFVQTSFYYEP